VLRARIEAAMKGVCEETGAAFKEISVVVEIEDIAPSHPTREQLNADPALAAGKTGYLGGADLLGAVLDEVNLGQIVREMHHRYFAPSLKRRSPSPDTWADANVAIDQLAVIMAKECAEL